MGRADLAPPASQPQSGLADGLHVVKTIERDEAGLTLHVGRRERRWIEAFMAGPRQLQGRLRELLALPRRAPGAPLADWYPDPAGEFPERFWDGTTWTQWVYIGDRPFLPAGVYERPLP